MSETKGVVITVNDPTDVSFRVDESLPADHVEVIVSSPPAAMPAAKDDVDPEVE